MSYEAMDFRSAHRSRNSILWGNGWFVGRLGTLYTSAMVAMSKVWAIRLGVLFATCLGVFALPFLLPPPYFQGVSASNLAGFNNRVAAMAAAGMAVVVFFLTLKWPQIGGAGDAKSDDSLITEHGRLPRALVAAVVLLWGVVVLVFGILILRSGITYPGDWGYFINRIGMHTDFGRKLYTQIEFPYGPLLFYGPVAVRGILGPIHISLAGAYAVTLMLEIMMGILLIAYVIDHLPMSKRWKVLIFLLLAGGMLPVNMGLNYTFFRFAPPLAFLIMASQRKQPWTAMLWIFVGQVVCLGLSPEIGFAFFASSFGYAAYRCWVDGWRWVPGIVAPILATAAFLLLTGRPYLRMVELFAHGVLSLPVEPLPHICLFLFALVWLIPGSLAGFFRARRPEAPMMAALFVVSMALSPSALGRADPWHIFWNGLSVFLLATLAISSRRISAQIAWGVCVTALFVWMCAVNHDVYRGETGPVLHGAVAEMRGKPIATPGTDSEFDLHGVQAIVGHDSVVLPEWVPLQVEHALEGAGQLTPTFYYFQVAVLDSSAEDHEIQEFNQSKWALIQEQQAYRYAELPGNLLGFEFSYPIKRPIYTVGMRFAENLKANWRIKGKVGTYLVYEHVDACDLCNPDYRAAGGA
jgi:hypothetical protein